MRRDPVAVVVAGKRTPVYKKKQTHSEYLNDNNISVESAVIILFICCFALLPLLQSPSPSPSLSVCLGCYCSSDNNRESGESGEVTGLFSLDIRRCA